MAVTYLRLFDPVNQFQLKNGAINVSGRLYVYLEGTDDYADLFDENGSQLSQPVVLDNNGRAAGLYVDSKKTYWMKVNDQYDTTLFTIRKMTPCGGGGGSVLSGNYDVVSTDGSVVVDKSVDAGNTTFDLSVATDGTDLLEWFRCDAYTRITDTNIYKPVCLRGNMGVGAYGVMLGANRYYHVTAHVFAEKSEGLVQPYYDEINVRYALRSPNFMYDITWMQSKQIVDWSMGLTQEFEVSTDVIPSADCELLVFIEYGSESTGYFGLKNMEIHRVFSGAPAIPSGVLSRDQADAIYQPLLTAGDNIVIDQRTWTISATGGGGGGGGAIYTSGDGIIVQNTGNHEISIDDTVVQRKLTAGDNITINGTTISANVPAPIEYQEGYGIDINPTTHVISLDGDFVEDSHYVHTDNNFTTADKDKLDGIQSGAERNVQSDWNQTNTSADDYIKNKPDLSNFVTQVDIDGKADKVEDAVAGNLAGLDATGNLTDSGVSAQNIVHDNDYVHTDNNFTDTDKDKLDGIEAGAEENVIEKVKLNNVDLPINSSDKSVNIPIAIPTGDPNATAGAMSAADKYKLDNIEAGAQANVQSDWAQTDITADDYIKNKPNIPSYAWGQKELVAGANITLTSTETTVIIDTATPSVVVGYRTL